MRYAVLAAIVLSFLCVNITTVSAARPKAKAQTVAKAVNKDAPVDTKTNSPSQTKKDALIASINVLRNQELRVVVVQQILSEEMAKLDGAQKNFCNQYKLDVEKFRKGLYRYDENEGKFIEVAPQPAKPAPVKK